MKINRLLTLAIVASLGACGGGGGGGDSTPTTTDITTSEQATSVASSSVQAVNLASSSVSLSSLASGSPAPAYRSPLAKDERVNKLAAAQFKARQHATRLRAATLAQAPTTYGPYDCDNIGSGTYTLTSDYDPNTNISTYTITYTNCLTGDMLEDGTLHMEGVETYGTNTYSFDGSFTMSGSPAYTMTVYDAVGSTNVLFTVAMDITMDLSEDGSYTDTATAYSESYTYSMNANGVETYQDSSASFQVAFQNFSSSGNGNYSYNYTTYASSGSGTDTANGKIVESWTDVSGTQGFTVSYTNFAMNYTYDSTHETYAVNGTVAMDFNPDLTCSNGGTADGTFTLVTNTPVNYDYSLGYTTAGKVTINSNTVMTYNSDGSVTVTVDGVDTNVTSVTDLEMICPVETTPNIS